MHRRKRRREGVGSCSDSWCPPPCNGFIMRHICDLSGRTTRIHGHRWSSKEEEEEEKNFFLISPFSRPSSFFIRPFAEREKTYGGSKDPRIFSFVETSVSCSWSFFLWHVLWPACTVLLRRSNQRVPRFRRYWDGVFSGNKLTRDRTLCFLARKNRLRGMVGSRWWDVVPEMGEGGFWIYIYDARKISLDLDEFSIKKKSIDVIQNSNPAKSEERERAFVFYFVAEVDPRNTHKEVWLVETNYEEAVHRYFSFSRAWREVLARAGIHGPKLAD